MPKKQQSSTFLEKQKILELEREYEDIRHKYRMEELRFMRENDRIRHELDLETIRIKSAEIRRSKIIEIKRLKNEQRKNI